MDQITAIAGIALFGAVGAVARYTVSDWTHYVFGESFPHGTLAVNLIGCFLLGAAVHICQTTELVPVQLRPAITIGMLGAFTTFSTFSYDTLKLLQSGQWHIGLLNVAANVVFGLLAVWVGIAVAKQFYGGA